MDKTIKEQLEAIRRSGETNMLDMNQVQQIANREGFYELVIFIEEHRSEYIKFIFYGDTENASENAENVEGAADLADTVIQTETVDTVTEYRYGLTGQKRKELVEAISRIFDLPAAYQKAPTFAYKIGEYMVDRNGSVTFPDSVSPVEAEKLIVALEERGFTVESTENILNIQDGAATVAVEEDEEETVERMETVDIAVTQDEVMLEDPTTSDTSKGIEKIAPETNPEGDKPENLTIEIPRNTLSDTAYLNLQKIIASKATLLKQALETETLEIKETAEKLCFPWFTLHDGVTGEADAYAKLITAMVEMAKKQKRVVATERPLENAKFTMRLFLIRLGFIGDEYKTARKILLRNLTGNSSWRYGKPPKKPATKDVSSFPPNPQDASSTIPDNAFSDMEPNTTNTETNIPGNKEVAEGIYPDHSDTFPEDKGGVPYDR